MQHAVVPVHPRPHPFIVLSLHQRRNALTQTTTFPFDSDQRNRLRGCPDLCFDLLDVAPVFLRDEEDTGWLTIYTDSRFNNPTFSASLQAQFFHHLGKEVLPAYPNILDCVDWKNSMEGPEHEAF